MFVRLLNNSPAYKLLYHGAVSRCWAQLCNKWRWVRLKARISCLDADVLTFLPLFVNFWGRKRHRNGILVLGMISFEIRLLARRQYSTTGRQKGVRGAFSIYSARPRLNCALYGLFNVAIVFAWWYAEYGDPNSTWLSLLTCENHENAAVFSRMYLESPE